MASIKGSRCKTVPKEFILEFCETKMSEYTSRIFKAFYDNDWTLMEDLSMEYEADCYSIGAIEIVGKLIKLRLQLQDKPIEKFIIENTLNGLLENSSKVQQFLIGYLENHECHVALNRLHYVSKPVNQAELGRRNWVYNNCCIM